MWTLLYSVICIPCSETHCVGLKGDEALRERSLFDEAVDLKHAIQRDTDAMRDQAATPLM